MTEPRNSTAYPTEDAAALACTGTGVDAGVGWGAGSGSIGAAVERTRGRVFAGAVVACEVSGAETAPSGVGAAVVGDFGRGARVIAMVVGPPIGPGRFPA